MNELVVAGRSLIVRDQVEFIDLSLDQQIKAVKQEVEAIETEIDGLESSLGRTLNLLAFRYPALCEEFRRKLNKYRELQGEMPVPKNVDPASMRDKDGKNEDEERAKIEKESEEEARKAIESLDDSELTPNMKKAKYATRLRKEKCKRFYAKIAQKTHPDKCKDVDLNNLFHEAKKAYEALDLEVLQEMHKDLRSYLKMAGKRGKFRDFKATRLKNALHTKDQKTKLAKRLKSSLAFECYKAFSKGDPIATKEAYMEFIAEQCINIDEAIDGLRQQLYTQRRKSEFSMPDSLRAELMRGF